MSQRRQLLTDVSAPTAYKFSRQAPGHRRCLAALPRWCQRYKQGGSTAQSAAPSSRRDHMNNSSRHRRPDRLRPRILPVHGAELGHVAKHGVEGHGEHPLRGRAGRCADGLLRGPVAFDRQKTATGPPCLLHTRSNGSTLFAQFTWTGTCLNTCTFCTEPRWRTQQIILLPLPRSGRGFPHSSTLLQHD